MAMNLPGGPGEPAQDVFLEINTTPLIDVMLVLLIMLIINVPLQNHAINMSLPTPAARPLPPPTVINLDLAADGVLHWNGALVADPQVLEMRLRELASAADPYELQVRPDPQVPYRQVAMVMAAAQRLGVVQVGIVSQGGAGNE